MTFADFKPDPKNPQSMVGPNGYTLDEDRRTTRDHRGHYHQVPSGFFYPNHNGCALVSISFEYAFSFEGAFAKMVEKYPALAKGSQS